MTATVFIEQILGPLFARQLETLGYQLAISIHRLQHTYGTISVGAPTRRLIRTGAPSPAAGNIRI